MLSLGLLWDMGAKEKQCAYEAGGQDLPRLCPGTLMPFCNLRSCPWLLEWLSTEVFTEQGTTGECSYDDCHSFPWMFQQGSNRLLMERPGAGGSFWAVRELGIISQRKLEYSLKEWGTDSGCKPSHLAASPLGVL